MNKIKQLLLTILIISLLTSCEFIKNSLTYKEKTKNFIEALEKEDYDNAINHFALEHEMFNNTDIGSLKKGLLNFREQIVKNFGTKLNYSLMKTEKKFSTREGESTPPNTTVAHIQFSNDKEFGVFKILFDDTSGKIININALDVRNPIPSMTVFWLFGLLALCVPIFNIYVIRQIRRSNLKKKWLKYVSVIFLNFPSITYAAVNGLSFDLVSFQILLGASFSYMGFLYSYWTFGIPIGGFYWFWKLRQKKDVVTEDEGVLTTT